MIILERERTSTEVIMYIHYTYIFRSFSELHQRQPNRLRKKEEVMLLLNENGFKGLINPKRVYFCKRVSAFLIDETVIHIGGFDDEA